VETIFAIKNGAAMRAPLRIDNGVECRGDRTEAGTMQKEPLMNADRR
jgi:hypothetical protein